jgi:hypothetical protein
MRLTGHDYVIEAFATSWPDEPLDALGGINAFDIRRFERLVERFGRSRLSTSLAPHSLRGERRGNSTLWRAA